MATVVSPNAQGLKVINIHEAKTHLSRLVEEAASGHPFIIAKSGKPRVKVVRLDEFEESEPKKVSSRLGFLKGKYVIPYDTKTQFHDEIEEMFYGKE
jgi:prevent-host-death family protein